MNLTAPAAESEKGETFDMKIAVKCSPITIKTKREKKIDCI